MEPPSLEKIGNEVARLLHETKLKEKKAMNDLITATIRTTVPSLVGTLVLFLSQNGINLDSAAIAGLVSFLVGLFTASYYLGVRLIGKKFPQAEWLLGVAKTPEYKEAK